MDKTHTTLNVERDLLAKAKDKGLNISNELDRALKIKLGEKVPKELIRFQCAKCGAFVDAGYWCPESRKAWCKPCHDELNLSLVCREWHKPMGESKERLHYHNPFGNVPTDNYGKTLNDIERSNANHQINKNSSTGGF